MGHIQHYNVQTTKVAIAHLTLCKLMHCLLAVTKNKSDWYACGS